ncbi:MULTISPECIES: hypothetical protein [Tissierella]|uniref:hypothetical protein n=1 Tax=Tissierella TaxID=41273 RepID=UPI000ED1DF27|nr:MULTISPECIES: hypothetical protein [Tissierella]MBU5256099.1 hypothetical protein [Tissierella praeacuta]HAE91929.1 hypothetical protein [Tissierella sp.]
MKKHYSSIIFGLYVLGAFIIIIPILVALISNKGFSPFFSKVTISISILCIEIGLLIKTFIMKKEGKSIAKNIGGIIGLLLVMIWGILK